MGLKDLTIIHDNPQAIYCSGQTVSGQLLVNTDTPKTLRNIIIKLKGEAECRWTESTTVRRMGKTHRKAVHYRGHEIYFENHHKVFGGSGEETLPPGEHFFPFSIVLPQNLPSSFEGEIGHIRYTIKATLDRPWKFDHEVKAAFTVINHLDLNFEPHHRMPVKSEDCKFFCCWCCKSGPLTLVAHIPATGYVPGQNIPMTVEVDNASNVVVEQVTCELQKYVTYHSTSPPKSKTNHVMVKEFVFEGSVGENDSRTWNEQLTVPPLPPSILRECRIIDLEYKLKVKVKPEGMHADLTMSIPVTIGTIPLWQSPAAENMPSKMPAPTAPSMETPTAPSMETPTAPYPDMPPPTYEECVFGTENIGDSDDSSYIMGKMGYNPRYPTYNLPFNPTVGWAPPK